MATQLPKMQFANSSIFHRKFIYFAVCSANLLSFSIGVCFNWLAIIIPRLTSNDTTVNPLPRPILVENHDYLEWGMNQISLTFIPLYGGILITYFGKKKTLLIAGLPLIIAHLLSAFEMEIWCFYVVPALMGISIGMFFGPIIGYMTDISTDKNRGALAYSTIIFTSIGGLFVYSVGPHMSVKVFSLINLIPLVLFYLTFGLFVPESPYDLMKKDKTEEAKRSLRIFRGENLNALDDEILNIFCRVKKIEKMKMNKLLSKLAKIMKIFGVCLISNGILVFQQVNGMGKIARYMINIYGNTGGVIIATVALFSTILSSQLVDKLGRKKLLTISTCFVGMSVYTFLIYFFLKWKGISDSNVDFWIPIIALIILVCAFSMGSIIPWLIVNEIFSFDMKDLQFTWDAFFAFLIALLAARFFPGIDDEVGFTRAYFILGIVVGIGFILLNLIIPETKGQSHEAIQEMLDKNMTDLSLPPKLVSPQCRARTNFAQRAEIYNGPLDLYSF